MPSRRQHRSYGAQIRLRFLQTSPCRQLRSFLNPRSNSWAWSISKEVNIHSVRHYPFAGCIGFVPEKTKEVSVNWINVKGMEHLLDVTHDSYCLPPKAK